MSSTGSSDDLSRLVTERIMADYKEAIAASPMGDKAPKKGDDFKGEVEAVAEGAVMFSDLFPGAKAYLAKYGKPDFAVNNVLWEKEDWSESDREFIPDLDESYVWQFDLVYPAMLALVNNLKTLVWGPTGSGKTTLYKNIAALLNQPYLRISGRGDMESDEILGRPDMQDGNMTFELGEFPKAYAAGWLIAIDEPWKMPAGIQMTFQRVYERDGILQLDGKPGTLKDKQIYPTERTRLILCDNVVGTGDGVDQYAATNIQDSSTINRMDLVLHCGYLPIDDEVKMLTRRYPSIPNKKARQAVQVANLVRKGYNQGDLSVTMSPRNLMAWMELSIKVRDYGSAFRWVMLERFADDVEKQSVKGHWSTVMGSPL